jgi:hypothetical protein
VDAGDGPVIEGSLWLGVLVGAVLVGGLGLERALLRWRRDPWFLTGFRLAPPPVPIARPPEGRGETATVAWEVSERDPTLVRFWARPGAPGSLGGLHGAVRFVPERDRVRLEVVWAPPWSPVVAALWLGILGAARGEGLLMVPLAVVMIVGLVAIFRGGARRAAAELRWAWVRGE